MPLSTPPRLVPVLLLAFAGLVSTGQAQVVPPSLPAPPALPVLPGQLEAPLRPVLSEADRRLADLRQTQARLLLRRHRDVLDTDPHGELIVRHEVLLLAPDAGTLQRVEQAGYLVQHRLELAPLGLDAAVLRAPPRTGTRQALRRLRRLAPEAEFAFNHVYLGGGMESGGSASRSFEADAPAVAVGLVDSGVDATHPALQGLRIERWGCEGHSVAAPHGTAVASLLAGDAAGPPRPGSVLFAADIYCGEPTGGAVTRLVQALAWLARHEVRVINLSVVGAENALLARAVTALQARGHLLVAAVGNDGPASPPLYPAAYSGVVGVTAVDQRQRLLPEALRGGQVAFAAPGAQVLAAHPGGQREGVRGTSFAAPLVARLAAAQWRPGDGPADVLTRLQAQALDLGERGRDKRFGHGLLGQNLALRYAGPER